MQTIQSSELKNLIGRSLQRIKRFPEEEIHITHFGKPCAVIISEKRLAELKKKAQGSTSMP
jgi:antitoxin (DNA-binding transcriptional repressor) of toxin-antitoxin stability system